MRIPSSTYRAALARLSPLIFGLAIVACDSTTVGSGSGAGGMGCGTSNGCNGTALWSKRFGDNGYQGGYGIGVDAAGNVLVTGQFNGTVDFGGGPHTGMGNTDIFVAKLDPNGNHLWSKRFGDTMIQRANTIAVDGAGNVLIAGDFEGAMDFGGGPLFSVDPQDTFVAKFDPNGNHLWSRRFGDAGQQRAAGAAVDAAGNLVVVGYFDGAIDFGNGPLESKDNPDIFLAKLTP